MSVERSMVDPERGDAIKHANEATKRRKEQLSPDQHPFRIWWECSACDGEVMSKDVFCSHCGVKFVV